MWKYLLIATLFTGCARKHEYSWQQVLEQQLLVYDVQLVGCDAQYERQGSYALWNECKASVRQGFIKTIEILRSEY